MSNLIFFLQKQAQQQEEKQQLLPERPAARGIYPSSRF